MKNRIRNWLKKLIADAIAENFPSMYITIEGVPNKKIDFLNCRFNNSKINITETEPDAIVELDQCSINIDKFKKKESFINRKSTKK